MNIGLCGLGKAGKKFVEFTIGSEQYCLNTVLCRENSNSAGKKVAEVTNINVNPNLIVKKISEFDNKEKLDVIIDFSNNPTTFELVDLCSKYKINLIICPTNFSDSEIDRIKQKAEESNIGIVFAPTLTVGINMLIDFVQKLSSIFSDFSFEIIEKHGTQKGSPTKTAKVIGESICRNNVNISSVRLDGFVGVHEVIATNGYECISLEHQSFSRDAFVNGALIAANYIYGKTGFFYIREIFDEMIAESYLKG